MSAWGPKHARFVIVDQRTLDDGSLALVISDVGPWDKHLTVTNDAEDVVDRLRNEGRLPIGQRLLYYDANGELDEIVMEAGRFLRFGPCPPGGGGHHAP